MTIPYGATNQFHEIHAKGIRYDTEGVAHELWNLYTPHKDWSSLRTSGGSGPYVGPSHSFRGATNYHTEWRRWTPYNGHVIANNEDGSYEEYWDGGFNYQDHLGLSPPEMDGSSFAFSEERKARCQNNALIKLGDVRTQVMQNLATAVHTHNMIASRASDLASVLLAYRNRGPIGALRSIKSLVKQPRAIRDAYLEWQYGWKPLVSDLAGLFSVIRDNLDDAKPPIVTGKAIQSGSSQSDYTDRGYEVHGSYEYRYCCKIVASVDSDSMSGYRRTAHQLGLDDPLWVAWDLVPYSFIVDWFLPVGNYLEAMNATIGLSFMTGYNSHSLKFRAKTTRVPLANWDVISPMGGEVEGEQYTRQVLGSFPSPELVANESPFSSTHITEALALIRGLRGKH